eukprot:TRINITY_DN81184_c0_g1_i1.p1 TRINITY_DN81184_c0_g1~~TRINITY_DN81184_c0_g1_i1.p1  ORF type:complete len:248 (-),score=59.95 TRINITY_DN81184_c0_g1_i1:89-832(-)
MALLCAVLRSRPQRLKFARSSATAVLSPERQVLGGIELTASAAWQRLWAQTLTFPKRRPFAFNMIFATLKTGFADAIVQVASGEELDLNRNALFMAFGFAYSGAFQWLVYVNVFGRCFPNAIRFTQLSWSQKLRDRAGQLDLVRQTMADNFIHYTFFYFPAFYAFKEYIQCGSQGKSPTEVFSSAMARYRENFWTDNIAMWSLWIPADIIIYSVPLWLRLPVNHGVSLVWTMILSWMRGSSKSCDAA